jgi:subtilisin family serine protease
MQGINVTGYNGNLPWNQGGSGDGTHVADTIAAMNKNLGVVGVTPGTVQLYIGRVFNPTTLLTLLMPQIVVQALGPTSSA